MSSDLWRWADPNGQQRKVRLDELRASLAAGIIAPNAPVWRPGFPAWQPAHEVPELTSASVGGANGVVLNIPPPPLAMVAVQQEYEAQSPSIAPMPPSEAGAPEPEPPPPPAYVPVPAKAPSMAPPSSQGLKTQVAGSAHVPARPAPSKPPVPPSKMGSSLPTSLGLAPPPGLAEAARAHAPTELDADQAATAPVVHEERPSLGVDESAFLPKRSVLDTLREDLGALTRRERPKNVPLLAAALGGSLLVFVLLVAGVVSLASAPSTPAATKPVPSAKPSPKPSAAEIASRDAIPPPPPASATPPEPPAGAAFSVCTTGGEPKSIAPRAAVATGIEAHALNGGLALGFAPTPREAVVTSLDPSTLVPTATVRTKPVGGEARRVTPLLVGNRLTAMPDVERKGDKLAARRVVAASTLVDVGVADGAIVWAPHGRDSFAKLFALDGDASGVEALRAIPLGDRKGVAIAFRRGGTIAFGAAKGENVLEADGELSKVAGLGGQLGSPSLAVSGDTIVVAWADRGASQEAFSVRWAKTKVGSSTTTAQAFALPEGGLGGQAMSPSVAALGGGNVLLAWTEGPVSGHQVRAITLGADGATHGAALAVSGASENAGQASVVVGPDGKGAVAYLAAKGKGFELHATPITCAAHGRD